MVENGNYLINLSGATANELILKPVYFDADINSMFRKMFMNKTKQKIAFADTLENILQSRIGCGWRPKGDMAVYERCVNLEELELMFEFCVDEIQNTVYEEALRIGMDVNNITGTVYESVIRTRIQQAIKKDLLRLAFWGRQSSADENYNLVDGVWPYLFDLVNQSLVPYTNTASGAPLAAGDAVDFFQRIWENATKVLKNTPASEKIIYVSSNIYEAWLKDLEDGVTNDAMFFTMNTQEVNAKSYRGIQIMPMYDWDAQAAAAYPATFASDANLMIYTTRNNLILASDVTAQDSQYEAWYEKKDRKWCASGAFKIGFNYALEDYFSVGY